MSATVFIIVMAVLFDILVFLWLKLFLPYVYGKDGKAHQFRPFFYWMLARCLPCRWTRIKNLEWHNL